jgi:hypothetical protein
MECHAIEFIRREKTVIEMHSCAGPLVLLDPRLLPEDRKLLARAVPALSAHGIGLDVLGAPLADRHRVHQLLGGNEIFGRWASSRTRAVKPRRSRADAQCREHDDYFGVTRVARAAGENFLAGLIAAYLRVLDHTDRYGTDISDSQWQALIGLPHRVFGYASPAQAVPQPTRVRLGGLTLSDDAAAQRWRVGHQLYFVVIQSLTVAMLLALRAAEQQDEAATVEALALAASCADAAAAAMAFTSEFPLSTYVDRVQPTMLPPHVGLGFSGFATRDHRRLVTVFRQLHAVRSDLASVGEPYERFVSAVEDMYAAHGGVCAHFGGDRRPSLRMQLASGDQPTTTGVAAAEKLARHRIGLIEAPRRCPLATTTAARTGTC